MGLPGTSPPPTSSPPTAGRGTGGGSPSAGSAVSASAAQTHARQVADSLATFQTYIGQLQFNGMKIGGNIEHLVHNAANGLWSMDRFIFMLSHTKEFHQAFPGILGPGGRLRMDPTTYISNRNSIAKAADQAGVNLTKKQLDKLMVNRVSPDRAANRFQVEAAYQANKGSLEAFNEELKAQGHKAMTKAGMTQFLMGQAPSAFYTLYRNWQTRTAAEAAGFTISTPVKNKKGKVIGWNNQATDLSLTRQQELAIAGAAGGPSGSAPNLQQAAQMFRDILPESRMAAEGITKDDLIQYLYGGPKQATIQDQVDQFTKNLAAEGQENPVSYQIQTPSRGLASRARAQGA